MNYHAPPASAAALEALKSEISARSEEFQALRHIPKDIVAKFQAVGVYRAFVPKRFGGDELAPQDFCRLVEEISTADASAGWVASFGVSATYLAALPPETYAAIYGANPNTVLPAPCSRRNRQNASKAVWKSPAAGPGARASWVRTLSAPASRSRARRAPCPAPPSCRAPRRVSTRTGTRSAFAPPAATTSSSTRPSCRRNGPSFAAASRSRTT